jgi:hypothetical protein
VRCLTTSPSNAKLEISTMYFSSDFAMNLLNYPAGCSKSPSSKAAGESKPEAYPLGYVEDFDDPRTKLAGFFSILLAVRWPRVYSGSDGHLDPGDPLHVGAEITETGGD